MLAYLARRAVFAIFTLWAVSVLSFIIIQLPPGDFVDAYMAQLAVMETDVSELQMEAMRRQYALDRPIHEQYLRWIGNMVQGNFGVSMLWKQSVRDVIGDRLAMTMAVSLGAVLLTWAIAVPIGIYSAVHQYSIGDYFLPSSVLSGCACPVFFSRFS